MAYHYYNFNRVYNLLEQAQKMDLHGKNKRFFNEIEKCLINRHMDKQEIFYSIRRKMDDLQEEYTQHLIQLEEKKTIERFEREYEARYLARGGFPDGW